MLRINKKILSWIVVLAALCVIIAPHIPTAQAGGPQPATPTWLGIGLNWLTGGAAGAGASLAGAGFTASLSAGLTLLLSVVSFFVAGSAFLAGLAIDLSSTVTQLPIVQIGFSVSLALANLGFVLGIIVIAIATILRIESYGVKQILWKLIVMAILVNFGLVIAGSVLSASNSLTGYFLTAASPAGQSGMDISQQSQQFATAITSAFKPQAFLQPPDQSAVGGEFSNFTILIIGGIFSIIFLALITFQFLLFAVMFIIRFVFLAFLLVLLPFAWLSWVFPIFHSNWEKWWHYFLKWTLFAPICIFFLYLAVIMTQAIGASGEKSYIQEKIDAHGTVSTGIIDGADADAKAAVAKLIGNRKTPVAGGPPTPLQAAVQAIILLALGGGGIFAANSLSIEGTSTVTSLAKSGATWAGRQAKAGTLAVGSRGLDYARGAGRQSEKNTSGKIETTTFFQRAGSVLQGVPGMGGVGARIAGLSNLPEDRHKEIEAIAKGFEGMNDRGVLSAANSPVLALNQSRAAAVAQALAKRNLWGSDALTDGTRDSLREAAERMGNAHTIYASRPDLAPPRQDANGENLEDHLDAIKHAVEHITPGEISKIDHNSLGDHHGGAPSKEQIAVALSLSNQQISKLGIEGSAEQIAALKSTLTEVMSRATSPIGTPPPPEHLDRLNRIQKFLDKNPQLQII